MRIIKYMLCNSVNCGTEEEPQLREELYPVTMCWNEANEEIAKREAYNGEYTIEDDGQPEPQVQQSPEERITELEEMLNALLGVSE